MASSRGTDLPTVSLVAAMYALLVGNFFWYQASPLPWFVHVAIGVIGIHLSFTSWHEAVHRNVSAKRWVSDLVGVFAIFPYMAPFYVEKWFHLQHHALLNQPDDPNRIYTDAPFWQIGFRYLEILSFARQRMTSDPRTRGEKILDSLPTLAILGLYAAAWYWGALLDLVLLWFVPLVISKVFMDWYINYLPHVGLPANRFGGTRIIDLAWFTPLVLGHNYHAIHHLWPDTPWHRYTAVFRQKREYLNEHGVPIECRLIGFGPAAANRPTVAD
ncbi:MAG: fatty acid desaturase [Myxococcota bacterium]